MTIPGMPAWRACLRLARRVCLALVLLVVVSSAGVRVHSYLLTRRIQTVLAGLRELRIDDSTEEELLKTVPGLVRVGGRTVGTGVERRYGTRIFTDDDRRWPGWIPEFFYSWSGDITKVKRPREVLSWTARVVHWLGMRHLAFSASVVVVDGKVTRFWYGIEPDVFLGWPVGYVMSVSTVHGFWLERGRPVPVNSLGDERPEARFIFYNGPFTLGAADASIGLDYTPDAPRELIAHAFEVDLSCFWSLRLCDSARQIAPNLFRDRQAVAEAADARIRSQNPCPDQILPGRVRYLPDLNVAVLEAVGTKSQEIRVGAAHWTEIVMDARLHEVLRGLPRGPWTGMGIDWAMPLALSAERVPYPRALYPKPGDRVLYFDGADFNSCRVIPATPSAIEAIRTAMPVPKRPGGELSFGANM